MDDLEESLVWSTSGTEESRLFYESSMKSLAKRYATRSEEEIAGEMVAQVFRWLSIAIDAYGKEGEIDDIVVRCQVPQETGGIWAFDVRFMINGRSSQVLAAARTIREVGDSLSKEISGIIKNVIR
jgi:hypothetical protein